MNIDKTQLNNKLNTLFVDQKGSNLASVQIWFKAGSALEDKDNQGIAHFLEHMFFKGTKLRPGAKIAHEVEGFGGEINAFTSFDYTCYYINCPVDNIEESTNILLDMVSNPTFAEDELIPERAVVFEEFRRSIDNPNQYNFSELQRNCFTNNYSHQILGTESSIKSFSRNQLIEFRKKFYNLENSMLVVAGDLKNKEKVIKTINKYQLPSGETSKFPKFKLKSKPQINVHQKDVRQTIITMAIQASEYDNPESPSQDLALSCLCHGEMSRFYKALVTETSVANSLSASTMYFADGGTHFLRFSFPHKNLAKFQKLFLKVFKEIITKGLSSSEVKKIKGQYVASKVYEKESIESFSFSLGHGFAQNGDINCENKFVDSLKHVSTNDVNKSLKEIFKKAIHFTVQIPQDEDKKKTKAEVADFSKKITEIVAKVKDKKSDANTVYSKFDPEAKLITLKPGVKLFYRQNQMTPTFVFHAYLKGGLKNENADNNGTYHLIAKMLTYGNKSDDYHSLITGLENMSASLHGFSGKNAYGLTMHGQSKDTSTLLKNFFDTYLEPKFPNTYLKHEKEIVFRSLDMQKQDPVKQCFKEFNKLIFDKHHYSLSLLGTNKSVKKITTKKLKDTHQMNIDKSDLLFTYCGDLDQEDLLEMINPYIEKLATRKPKKTTYKKAKAKLGKEVIIPFKREQTQIFIGTKAYSIHDKDNLYLKILSAYLSGQSSELFVEVRDKQGLCYSVQPIHHAALEDGYWGIYIAAGKEKTDAAIDAIKAILYRIAKDGFSKTEFKRIIKMIRGQNLISIQTNDDYANQYSIPILHDLGIDYPQNTLIQLDNIKLEGLNLFLKKFINSKWNTVKVGDLAGK
jgi:zinc protease